ncbi:Retrotransposon gag protein [Cynara cardunculus var. scolymus]|uniref:Retrotransposon gag protein n=1 Tax=Cynara cardunculus var. scolymus TaxID=59895 RepID=A0A103YFF6_CYNCS|nr:Retrotransposon gag protein [Cynara cardunculus var. scolymus]
MELFHELRTPFLEEIKTSRVGQKHHSDAGVVDEVVDATLQLFASIVQHLLQQEQSPPALLLRNVDWHDFVINLMARFKDETGINVVEQFNELQQHDSLEVYTDEFENLRSIMLHNNHALPDPYILDSFLGVLRPAVKPFVRAFKPTSIARAVEIARLQEESLVLLIQTQKLINPCHQNPSKKYL